jgi:obg-like ATPase 1
MHVENSVDPVRDLEIISDELLQKDIEIMTSHIEPIRRVAKADKTKRGDLDIAEKIFNWLSVEKKEIRLGTWNAKEVSLIVQYKPCYYYLVVFEAWIEARSKDPIIPYSAALELTVSNISIPGYYAVIGSLLKHWICSCSR